MTWAIDCQKHAARAAEARKRIALVAELDPAAAGQQETQDAAFAGGRAAMWLLSAIEKPASARLLAELTATFGAETVTRVCIGFCSELPPGPAAWLKAACHQHTHKLQPATTATKEKK